MTDPTEQTPHAGQTPATPRTRWQRFVSALPIGLALTLIAGVWAAGAVWSFEEQTAFAESAGFHIPQLLPLVLDGMAIAMAAVAWAASLDARPAVLARLGAAVAIAASATSNATWAWTRSAGSVETIVLAAGVPVVSMVAFEVLLSEVRRQVLRRRGQPGPVAITYPRLIRLALAPWPTFVAWRRLVLTATDPAVAFAAPAPGPLRVAATVDAQTPAPVAIADRPAGPQAPAADRTPRPARRISAARTGLVRQPVTVRVADSDAESMRTLREWRRANGGQMPSINQVQQAVGGGRSRAVRLRGLLANDKEA